MLSLTSQGRNHGVVEDRNVQRKKAKQDHPPKSRMKDIADAAGVSVMTVSRALREPDRVSEDTHKKIEKAIRKIGYIRDFIAESMRTNQTGIVSLLVPTLANSFFSTFIRGVSDTLQQRGYQLMICDYNYDLGLEERLIEACIGRRSDGIVTAGLEHSSKTRNLLERSHIPVVETWDLAPNVIDSQVGFSNEIGRAHV